MKEKNVVSEQFDPKKHIAKFCLIQHGAGCKGKRKFISADLMKKTLTIEIRDALDDTEAEFEYSLAEEMDRLLPLVRWEELEALQDIPEQEPQNGSYQTGHRNGWYEELICLNEENVPEVSRRLAVCYEKGHEPADERLLSWVKDRYADREELKKYRALWG